MIRRLRIEWPDAAVFAGRDGSPIRFLVASDEPEPSLRVGINRANLGRLDGILGCGDLEPEWLRFLADAFNTPLIYVRGNHDRGGQWHERPLPVPVWLPAGRVERLAGIPIVGLEWPGVDERGNRRRPWLAWRQAMSIAGHLMLSRQWRSPVLVISHVPPTGIGDAPADRYHIGFDAYRWLLRQLDPPVWLHGHTTTASVSSLAERAGSSVVANATGALLLELVPAGSAA